MAKGLGHIVDVVQRLQQEIIDSEVPLHRAAIEAALVDLLPTRAPLADAAVVSAVVDGLVGLGPIENLLREPDVSDVFVNQPDEVWVERSGSLERSPHRFPDAQAVVAAVERVIATLGLRLDAASPIVDARLPDGSRLHAAIPPVAVDGPVVAIRRFTQAVPDLDRLVARGAVSAEIADVLVEAVRDRRNLIVSGGTGAGKTTLLNILSRLVPATERVVTVEDAAELNLTGHVIRLEARPPNAEGAGAVTLETLIRAALRLRPDRIVVGEVRGPEALDMISAMNTGHDGSMSTVHANGPTDALLRLETLALSGGRSAGEVAVRRQLHAALDLIIHVERRGGERRVASVAAVTSDGVEEVAT